MTKKNWGRVVLILFLVVPTLWLLLWKNSTHTYERLPVLGEVELNGDTTPFVIRDFKLVNQEGDSVSKSDYLGKVYVANFFFASCPEVCPAMNSNLRLVVDEYRGNESVQFLSHSVDPYRDTVEVLKKYSKRFNAQAGVWNFVTGSKREIYDLAENYYRVNATRGSKPADFIHSEKLVLVDGKSRIRGYFESSEAEEIERLIDAIKILLKERRDNE
jgi:protein SCO1/2